MGNFLFEDCNNPEYDNHVREKNNNNKNKIERNILDEIIFNKEDLEEYTEDINFNDEFQREKNNLEFGYFLSNKFGIPYNQKNDNIKMKDSNFNIFTQTLFRKVGIIILLSEDIQTSFNRLKRLLNMLEQELKNNTEEEELLKKKCSIFILNKKYEMYSFVMAFAGLDTNDLPTILFVKKDFENQKFDGECIKLNTSNFNSPELIIDTLMGLLESLQNDDNDIQNNNYDFDFDNLRHQKYPENELIVPENQNHNYFINIIFI